MRSTPASACHAPAKGLATNQGWFKLLLKHDILLVSTKKGIRG